MNGCQLLRDIGAELGAMLCKEQLDFVSYIHVGDSRMMRLKSRRM
ncbi:hypothetical protein ALP91_01661 [Pseudomonas savastanoi pv. glycinea]|nr:hypothetical protein ALP91_01661 [Pseudomonas savastanoi pv. glycinea]